MSIHMGDTRSTNTTYWNRIVEPIHLLKKIKKIVYLRQILFVSYSSQIVVFSKAHFIDV